MTFKFKAEKIYLSTGRITKDRGYCLVCEECGLRTTNFSWFGSGLKSLGFARAVCKMHRHQLVHQHEFMQLDGISDIRERAKKMIEKLEAQK